MDEGLRILEETLSEFQSMTIEEYNSLYERAQNMQYYIVIDPEFGMKDKKESK